MSTDKEQLDVEDDLVESEMMMPNSRDRGRQNQSEQTPYHRQSA